MTMFLLTLAVHAQLRISSLGGGPARLGGRRRPLDLGRLLDRRRSLNWRAARSGVRQESGQATAEYALVLLGVAAIALLLAAWAAKSGKVGQLFDSVVDELISKVK